MLFESIPPYHRCMLIVSYKSFYSYVTVFGNNISIHIAFVQDIFMITLHEGLQAYLFLKYISSDIPEHFVKTLLSKVTYPLDF
jgi:hypothetical protein